jgi:predicted lipid-binding transport protein (Tim44 family)
MIGGLIAGGLLGSMMGHGGGWGMGSGGMGGGFLISLIQLLILGGVIWFVIGLFRRNSKPAPGSVQGQSVSPLSNAQLGQPAFGGSYGAPSQSMVGIVLTDSDKAAFERLLMEVQDAFGHEEYGRLREVTTPEIMSYLSEELSQNATNGRRNDVSGTHLIEADVSEAWREGNAEFATIAMRYASIDVMRDRTTNAIVEGDLHTPTETTEVWTFVRPISGVWKLSAIQE